MADSNRARTGRRQLILYLGEPDAKRLAETAQLLGESMNAVMRMALRDFLRRVLPELQSRARGGPPAVAPPAPHSDRVETLFCSVGVKNHAGDETVEAWVRARLTRDYPLATVRVQVVGARSGPPIIAATGSLSGPEDEAVVAHLEEAVSQLVVEFLAIRASRR
jgi:hypothetical protein